MCRALFNKCYRSALQAFLCTWRYGWLKGTGAADAGNPAQLLTSSMWVHFELTVWCKNSHRDGKFWGKRSRRMMALHPPSIHSQFSSTRYLERAVIPDRPRPASRMEKDYRHGWYLLLAHSYRHHSVGTARHSSTTPWTDGVHGPG